MDLHDADWRTSSYTDPSSNNCVEVSDLTAGNTAMRDSKNPHQAVLTFPPHEWHALVVAMREEDM